MLECLKQNDVRVQTHALHRAARALGLSRNTINRCSVRAATPCLITAQPCSGAVDGILRRSARFGENVDSACSPDIQVGVGAHVFG
jgi:hypothetical protein